MGWPLALGWLNKKKYGTKQVLHGGTLLKSVGAGEFNKKKFF